LEVLLDPFEDPLVFRRWPVPVGTNGGTSVFPLPTTAGIIKRQHAHLDARLAYYKKTDEESNGWQTIPQPQSPSKIWPKVPPFPPPPRRSALPLVEGEQEPQSIPLKSTNRPTGLRKLAPEQQRPPFVTGAHSSLRSGRGGDDASR
jgi:hypothetical protein